jgi:sucrose-6-phosphate hydrolase SacC (GH32 family)
MWYDEEKEVWRLILGSGQDGKGGMILQYSSSEGLGGPWEFVSVLLQGTVRNGSDSWECPDMFQLEFEGELVWVLMFGDNGSLQRCYYMLGTVDDEFHHFSPLPGYEEGMILDAGDYYAAKTSLFGEERLLWGWVQEASAEAAYAAAGWAGAQALPRELGLATSTGPMTFTVASNFTALALGQHSGYSPPCAETGQVETNPVVGF